MHTIGHDIGKGLSLWIRFHREEEEAHADVDAFFAPSECHALVSKGEHKRERRVRRHIKAVTGLRWRLFVRECERRTSPRTMHGVGL